MKNKVGETKTSQTKEDKRLEEKLLSLEKKLKTRKLERRKLVAAAKDFKLKNKILFMGHPGNGFLGPHGTWELNEPQLKLVNAVNSGQYDIFIVTGNNQQGKTALGLFLAMAMVRGCWPWENIDEVGTHLWQKYGWDNSKKFIRIASDTWEGRIRKNILEQGLELLWPESWVVKKRLNHSGIPDLWKPQDYNSQIQLMAYLQGRPQFESVRSHLFVLDEPWKDPGLWPALIRGRIAVNGLIYVGASVVGPEDLHMSDLFESLKKNPRVFMIDTKNNPNIGHGISKENFYKNKEYMSDEDWELRFGGGSLMKRSRVLEIDDKHCIPRFKIPHFYWCSASFDIGVKKGHDALIEVMDEKGIRYLAFELNVKGTENFASQFIDIVKNNKLRMNPEIIVDPLAKTDENHDLTTWRILEKILCPYGLFLTSGSKNKSEGVRLLNSYLRPMDTIPRLYLFDDMKRTISQFKALRYDERGLVRKPRPDEKPGDDQFENAYRLMLRTSRFQPYIAPEDRVKPKKIKRHPITGY